MPPIADFAWTIVCRNVSFIYAAMKIGQPRHELVRIALRPGLLHN
ncbi:hypothetical protein RY831_00125 [Noviherbaspirillum sp. CPCC 100848]|uniref:Uncharacterized protein n=1 Tax=Noviherbaspirillum album TaxID=3080276 RepID=A0ABU6J1Q7_9BURK|nr:hypothetical protein [Noviherbaspirillum sp. CPCC 100848]MEC4717548.1 hypothetical protein [Noviherbaspirillum sp. CPCC 100848]